MKPFHLESDRHTEVPILRFFMLNIATEFTLWIPRKKTRDSDTAKCIRLSSGTS